MELETQNEVQKKSEKNVGDVADEKILLIVFKLGASEYALSIDQIKEVVLTPRISEIPQTPAYIKGVANIRGTVISIIDLEARFGLKPKKKVDEDETDENNVDLDTEKSNYTLVVESEEFKIGVLVKEVPNTYSIKRSEIDSSSDIIRHSSLDENAIKGIVKIDERMIILINVLSMMETGGIQTTNE
ncbi:MAG: chemotaxis protein CheW [Cyclobacteriaceae bacterium]|nr:chemotaxis protein CheW [Cyclobacteriaceae bacterium]